MSDQQHEHDEIQRLRSHYDVIESGRAPIKAWTKGVGIEEEAIRQLQNTARLPIVHGWVAAMPDVHFGLGATVGSVIPTKDAIIPAAVGVDIGCGMMAVRTTMRADQLPDDLREIRTAIERTIPHGFTTGRGRSDRGSWGAGQNKRIPAVAEKAWERLRPGYERIIERAPSLDRGKHVHQLGTLGSGNHFIEVCLDEEDRVWIMLHSGSRGVGNRIGMTYVKIAQKDMRTHIADLPHKDLAYLKEGTEHFDDYVFAVEWAQNYARKNRDVMMALILEQLQRHPDLPSFRAGEDADDLAVNCHHNYVKKEHHYGADVFVTRKGAVRAGKGDLGIIPGSMGAKSFIVRGKGNPESFESCSHGAGRVMSRTKAKKLYTVEDHVKATEGVECRKDAGVIDETPMAYKDIDAVMHAQRDLVEIVHTLRQVVCVKG